MSPHLATSFLLVMIASGAASAQLTESLESQAAELFERYTTLERAFDPAVAELYSDDAYIENTRTYPTGEQRRLVVPAPRYKELIRRAMPLAAARQDRSTYSEITFKVEGERVRIRALRHSHLKDHTSPIELLVGPGPDRWLIYEEISQSVP